MQPLFLLAAVCFTHLAPSAVLVCSLPRVCVQETSFTSAIRAIAFDSEGKVWVGDDLGCIKVVALNEETKLVEEHAVIRSLEVVSKVGLC